MGLFARFRGNRVLFLLFSVVFLYYLMTVAGAGAGAYRARPIPILMPFKIVFLQRKHLSCLSAIAR